MRYLPGGFHRAAGEVYRRLEGFKVEAESPGLESVLAVLLPG